MATSYTTWPRAGFVLNLLAKQSISFFHFKKQKQPLRHLLSTVYSFTNLSYPLLVISLPAEKSCQTFPCMGAYSHLLTLYFPEFRYTTCFWRHLALPPYPAVFSYSATWIFSPDSAILTLKFDLQAYS